MRALTIAGILLTLLGGWIFGVSSGIRFANAKSVCLKLNTDKSVAMRAYDASGKIIAERIQSLDDPISTLWDY